MYLIRGREYLAKHPNYSLVGRENDLERISSILIRRSSNSLLLSGPNGVGTSWLTLGLQAAKAIPDTPFDLIVKKLFWLNTDALFSSGDSAKINNEFQNILRKLTQTAEAVLIISDTEKMVKQIEGLGDNNGNMIQIYAIMNEATKKVEKVHREERSELDHKNTGDNLLESMKLDEPRRNLDEHIDTVSTATIDTMQTYGELTTEAIKIRNMQTATKKQVESARAMHSRGIASVASQLSVVVTAVNSAASGVKTSVSH